MNEIALQWYRKLSFPKEFDEAFYKLAEQADVSEIDAESPVEDLLKKGDYGLNLVYFLSQCEAMYAAFSSRGIPEEIFYATAGELVREAEACQAAFGAIGVYEVGWFHTIINRRLIFRIGRLNFCMDTAGDWCNGGPVRHGDSIVSVHIPSDGRLLTEDCYQSMRQAERFFMQYYPEFAFKHFVCGSWLLYEGLDAFLGETSNIRDFRRLFTLYRTEPDESLIKFVFGRRVTRENIAGFVPQSSLQKKLQAHIVGGGGLFRSFGYRERMPEDI